MDRRQARLTQAAGGALGVACATLLVVLSISHAAVPGIPVCPTIMRPGQPLTFVGRSISPDHVTFYENFSFGTYPDFFYSVGPGALLNQTAANGTTFAARAQVTGSVGTEPSFAPCTGAGGLAACSANRNGWYVVLSDASGSWLASYPAPGDHWSMATVWGWLATNITVISPVELNATGDSLEFYPPAWGGCGPYVEFDGTL